jgi:carbamoyltransferase
MKNAYWGPQFGETEIRRTFKTAADELEKRGCEVMEIEDEGELCRKTARLIADGKIVGWFQGRMEWGPRALGNRSILADPRRKEMKDILNERIKKREWFRPFAPSIMAERLIEYSKTGYPEPFMLKVYPVREEKQGLIPAVIHADGTARFQTVNREDNPLYWRLLSEFEGITGVPIVLNTSFNENEPIVCAPEEALSCFLRTKTDVLVIGHHILKCADE